MAEDKSSLYFEASALGLQGLGQIFGGISAFKTGATEKKMYDYNAALKLREAKNIEAVTGFKQERLAEAGNRELSSMRTVANASGVVGGGILALAEQGKQNDLSNLILGYEGEVAASQARSEAGMLRMQGTMAKQAGKQQMIGSMLGAGGSFLQGFSKLEQAKQA